MKKKNTIFLLGFCFFIFFLNYSNFAFSKTPNLYSTSYNKFADSEECGVFNSSSSILTIPCVNINGKSYWLNLSLETHNNDNVTFSLEDFGIKSLPITLRVLHVNDVHSHLEPVDLKVQIDGTNYTYVQAGGYARIANYVKNIKNSEKNVLFLDAGDAVQGTLYYTEFKGEADSEVMNLMDIDAFVLGNHEFDNGAETLAEKFVNYSNFPIICADIDFSKLPTLDEKIKPYIIKEIAGEKIAIVGLDTDDTEDISNPGTSVKFLNYINSAKNIVSKLKSKGINKIIFLTHLGYNVDKQLAEQVEDIDIIVGGHSHTPLGNIDKIGLTTEGEYPTVVENNGKPILVVTAWKWGLLVGDLKVKFDSKGVIIKDSWKDSNPVMLISDKFIEKDSTGKKVEVSSERKQQLTKLVSDNPVIKVEDEDFAVKNAISKFSPDIQKLKSQVIGTALYDLINVRLPGDISPDTREVLKYGSMIAPLVAESMLWRASKNGGAQIAVQNAGGVRKSLYKGNITVGDVYELLPFGNTLVVFDMKGSELRATLENAIDRAWIRKTATGAFPYLAGARMFLDKSKPKGKRIVKLEVRNEENWIAISESKTYRIVTHSFLANGGDYYKEFSNIKGYKEDLGFVDAEVFMWYIKERGGLSPLSNGDNCVITDIYEDEGDN